MHSETACWNEVIGYSIIICQCHRAMIKPTRSCETSCLKSKNTWQIISSGRISWMPRVVYLVQVMDVMVSYPAVEKCNPSELYRCWSHEHSNPWISIKIKISYFLWPRKLCYPNISNVFTAIGNFIVDMQWPCIDIKLSAIRQTIIEGFTLVKHLIKLFWELLIVYPQLCISCLPVGQSVTRCG